MDVQLRIVENVHDSADNIIEEKLKFINPYADSVKDDFFLRCPLSLLKGDKEAGVEEIVEESDKNNSTVKVLSTIQEIDTDLLKVDSRFSI